MNGDRGNKAIGAIRDTGLSPACGLNVICPSMNSTNGLSDMAIGHFRRSRPGAWICELKV